MDIGDIIYGFGKYYNKSVVDRVSFQILTT